MWFKLGLIFKEKKTTTKRKTKQKNNDNDKIKKNSTQDIIEPQHQASTPDLNRSVQQKYAHSFRRVLELRLKKESVKFSQNCFSK